MREFTSPLDVPVTKTTGKKFILNLNNYRNTHYQTLNKAKIVYKSMVEAQLHGIELQCPIEVEYCLFPKTKRRTDLGNVLSIHQKFFEDALTELGCIPDDDYEHLVRSTFTFGEIDREDPRVEITVKELKNECNTDI